MPGQCEWGSPGPVPLRSIISAAAGCPHTQVPELDEANTSCAVKTTGLAQVASLRAPYVEQSLSLHHLHKNGVSTPCPAWKLSSAADSYGCALLCLGCPYSSPTSLNCPHRNIFLWSCFKSLLVLSPHFHSSVSLRLQLLGMELMGPRAPSPCAAAHSSRGSQPLVPHQLVPSHAASPPPLGIHHSAQHNSAWVRCLCSSSAWDPALSLSFCFLLFMVLDPAFRPCANALLPANLNSFQGRLHKSSGLVLGARPAGLAVLSSRAPVLLEDLLAGTPAKAESAGCLMGCPAGRSQRSKVQRRSGTGFANLVKIKKKRREQ